LDMPGVIFRHLLSKTMKVMPADQRYLADDLVRAKIIEALEVCQGMLAGDIPNPGYSDQQLEDGIGRFMVHLHEGRWEMQNGQFTRGRWRRISEEGAGRVEWAWEPFTTVPGTSTLAKPSAPGQPSPNALGGMEMEQALGRGAYDTTIEVGLLSRARTEAPDDFTNFLAGLDSIAQASGDAAVRDGARHVRSVLNPDLEQALAGSDRENVTALADQTQAAAQAVSRHLTNGQGALVISATTLLRDAGARQVLERLAEQTTDEGQPRFPVVVDARDNEERAAIEALHLPNVEVSQAQPG
jgi:hypothetical protein